MALEDVRRCCFLLDSDKITDRKKGCEQLRNLLNNSQIIAFLDKSPANDFNWSNVFSYSKYFFIKEAQKLEDDERKKPDASQSVLSNRANMKRNAAALPKLVLKKSSLKTPHISAKTVIDLVLMVLDRTRPYLLRNFAGDFIQIAQKYLFRFLEHTLQVPPDKLKDLLRICIWVYDELPNVDGVSVIGVLEGIVRSCSKMFGNQGGSNLPMVILRPFPGFLRRVFTNNKMKTQPGLQSSVLSLLLTFTKAVVSEWRQLICSIGEETFNYVLAMWDNRPSQRQSQILEYLNLIILVHDPQEDGSYKKDGSLSCDPITWQRCLHRLYQLIHDHLGHLSAKNKLAVGTGINTEQQVISQNLVLLAARLCSRIFQDTANYGVLDITQQGSTQMNADMNITQSGKASKRRRIEVGLEPLTALLREEGMYLHMIPWYQILQELLTSYSAFFDRERCLLTLEVFTYTLGESRVPAVQEHIIQCLASLAVQYNKAYPQESTQDQLRSGKWTPVWDLTLRLVSGKQCIKHGCELLQILMKTRLVSLDLSVFKLFYQGYVEMNEAAICTLLVALNKIPLPKTFKNDFAVLAQDRVQDARSSLQNVLLPLDVEGTNSTASLENPSLLAQVLMVMCLRDAFINQADGNDLQLKSQKKKDAVQHDSLASLEEHYLLSSFSKALPLGLGKKSVTEKETGTTDIKILPQQKRNMLTRLELFVNQVLAVVDDNGVSTQKHMATLLQILDLVVSLQLYTPDSKLENLLDQINKQIELGFQKLWSEPEVSRYTTLLPLLDQLSALYSKVNSWARYKQDYFTKNNGETVRKLFMSKTPVTLFPLILDMIRARTTKSSLNITQLGTTQTAMNGRSFSNTRNAADDDFDMDFDDADSNLSGQALNDFEQFENDNEDSSDDSGDHFKLDDTKSLNAKDQCIIASMKLVILTHGYVSTNQDDPPLLEVAELLEEFSKSNMLELCDVPLILYFVTSLFCGDYEEANIQDGFVLLSSVSKKYSSESQVASAIIKIIADLLSEHGTYLSESDKQNVICLSQAFSQKHQQGCYTQLVDESFFILTVEMTKLDPKREWCRYGPKNSDTVGELYHLLCSTSHTLRIKAAQLIYLPLIRNDASPMEAPHQDQMFRKIYEMALGNINIQTSVPEEFIKDEERNRISALLLTLGVIAANSPYLEAKSLFAMCFWAPDKEADSKLVARVVTRIAESQGKTLKSLGRQHLPYLAKEWIQHKNEIEAFPFSLLECSNSEVFIKDNVDILIPVLFECDETGKVGNLAGICNQNGPQLLQSSFPTIMAYIFPPIAAENDATTREHVLSAKILASKKHYKFLEKTLGSDVLNNLLNKHIDRIVLALFKLVHIPTEMVAREVIVAPNPPHFPPVVIEKTLDYLGGLFGENNPLVSVLATRRGELINVMVGVLGGLAHSSTTDSARRALSSVEVLVHALLPHLGEKLKDAATYIVNTLTHTLTFYTVKLVGLAPYLADRCNEILHSVCICAIECCPGSLSQIIPLLFTRLLPLTRESSIVKKSTLQILASLVMCEKQEIQKSVAYLPPLPGTGDYKSLVTLSNHHGQIVEEYRGELTLYDEVQSFLALSTEQTDAHSVSHLLKLIQNSKSQVKNLYSSPDVEAVTLGHHLTHCLMILISTANDKVALEASKCLGELGPIPLNTPIFHITKEKDSQLPENEESFVTMLIIKTLNRYLISEHIDVVEAASSSLLTVISIKEGYKALQEMGEKFCWDLLPYIPQNKPKAVSASFTGLDAEHYELEVGQDNLWLTGNSYEQWVINLACTLIEAGCGNDIITHVLPVCRVKADFSALMLPYIIHSTLLTDNGRKREILSKKVSLFFQLHVEKSKQLEGRISEAEDSLCLNKSSLHVLLNVIDYLRAQTPQRSFTKSKFMTPWDKNLWLQIDYLLVAQAAHFCGAYFSAILYLHLFSERLEHDMRKNKDKQTAVSARQLPVLQRMSYLPEATSLRRLMLQIYSSLGDSDGVEGCGGGSKLTDSASRALRCQHRGQWMETFAIHDAAKSTFGIITSMQELGLFNMLNLILNGSSLNPSPEVTAAQWESAWRLKQWDLEDVSGKLEEEPRLGGADVWNFHKHLFHCFQSLHHEELSTLHHHTLLARQGLVSQIKNSHAESSSSVYPLLTQLQILSEVEAASVLLKSAASADQRSVAILEAMWTIQDESFRVDFTHKEPIMAARISMLQALPSRFDCSRLLHRTLLTKSTLSRESLKISGMGCDSALLQAARLNVSKSMEWMMCLEEAQVARCKGDSQHAGQILNSLIEEMEGVNLEVEQEEVFCQSLILYGCILMDSRARPPNTIIKEYFNRAVNIWESKSVKGNEVLENSYHQLALYGDKLYRELRQHLESDTIQSKRDNLIKSKEECKHVLNLLNTCRDSNEQKEISRKSTILQKNIAIDQQVLKELEVAEQEYIYLALQNYLKCLLVSSKHDLHVHRVVALWLENPGQKINKLVHEFGSKMKSYKFVPLIYQLVARLTQPSDKKDNFPTVLFELLERACQDHPHHCLPVVMALANAHADDKWAKSGGRSRSQESQINEEDRVQAAKLLVNRLKETQLAEHVGELERVCLAYLSLANWTGPKEKYRPGDKVKISSHQPLPNLGPINHTAALTRPQPLQPSGYYTPPIIVKFEPVCTFVGGINAPKRLTLKTSDGVKQYELLKGKDDIRQDAVMEQVFGIVNELLAKNSETRDRSLSVRTYQVVPLSQKSGLIQWCDNTQAFGEYLIGPNKTSGAHKIYYPDDYTAATCRSKMDQARGKSQETRYEVFEDILNHFHPVFRHFFYENYPSPHEWYKRRLAYTRSVATNCMVGYILGLGDRHVENILLDKSTAEMIHIDLGIAFEFGKILPTPETVPFRLTQDVLDGLGVMGVEGPLRRCCEATLSVLRNSREVLVTVVEVLRHDPLHQWTLSPHQIARLQENEDEGQEIDSESSASMADRVVLRVQQKLAGVEDGYARSVSEQVTVLIQQATDISNLSRLFHGWQPYL